MHPGYFPVFFWSLLIFFSFWGYGELLRRRIDRPEFSDLGWGLTAAWGMAVVLAIGGVLMVLHLAKAPVLTIVVLVGAAAAFYYLVGKIPTKDTKSTKGNPENPKSKTKISKSSLSDPFLTHPAAFVLYVLVALGFTTSIFWPSQVDPNDDWIVYLMFPERILQTGTFLDPYSIRRIYALGGQSFLQAVVMVVGAPENGHILDRGFGLLLVFLILLKATQDIAPQWWFARFVVLLLPVTIAVPRINTASHFLGIALLIALVASITRLMHTRVLTLREAIPLGIVLAAASTLRPVYAMTGGGFIILYYFLRGIFRPSDGRTTALYSLALVGGLTFALLAPYMVLSYQSSGTPMFPFANGFANPQMIFGRTKEGGWADWSAAFRFFTLPEIAVMGLALLSVCSIQGRERLLAAAAALTACIMVFVSAYKVSGASTYDVYRYTFPLIAFAFFWTLARCAAAKNESYQLMGPATAVFTAAIVLGIHAPSISGELQREIGSLPLQLKGFQYPVARFEPNYRKLQGMVPAGEKIFAVVDAPYLLDYSRNPIENIDTIGASSPPPGIPFGKGPDSVKKFLLGQGFKYVLAVDFNEAVLLFTRKLWENHPRQEWYFKEVWSWYSLDFMNNFDQIANWSRVVREGNTRLIKLEDATEPQK